MTDILKELRPLSWRGIVIPVTGTRTATFSHEDVKHKFVYQDGQLVESLGAENWTFSYTLPMRQDIARGPYINLFTGVLPRLVIACRDRSPGILVDPAFGTFRVKCTQFTDELDVTRRDGSDVRLEFVQAPEADTVNEILGGINDIQGAKNEAGKLDVAVSLVDWEQQVPPEPTVDPFAALEGIGKQLEFQTSKIGNKMDEVAYRAGRLSDGIESLENGSALWPVRRSARRLQAAALRLSAQAANPEQRILAVKTTQDKLVSAAAADAKMDIQDFLNLNPGLAKTPLIPAGTVYRFVRVG